MTVCSCENCGRFISISAIPGGNPVALGSPESFSVTHRSCGSCGAMLCDRCAPPELMLCPQCHELLNPPPREGPYVYKKPTKRQVVMPGPGPTDFMELPLEPVERLLAAVQRLPSEKLVPGPFEKLNILYRHLGSPRAWQLGGEFVLRQLDPEVLKAVVSWARMSLDSTAKDCEPLTPGQKYFDCYLPTVEREGENWPERDLSNSEVIERVYWIDTMPIEFVESIAQLGDQVEGG